MLSQKELKKHVTYYPDDGIFLRNNTREIAGCIRTEIRKNKTPYKRILISIKNKQYKAHRLAFLYILGYIPKFVDHIDGNALNNKWSNLRPANEYQNCRNSGIKNTNTSGYKGVSKSSSKTNPWRAFIKVNEKQIHLGLFKIKKDAALAYNKAALKYFGEFARLNNV